MTTKSQQSITPSFLEDLSAEAKLAAYKQSSLVRGWKAITPDVIEAAQATDNARTDALTEHYRKRFS